MEDHDEIVFFFFFNDTATTEIYTLSLHDALPIFPILSLSDIYLRKIYTTCGGFARKDDVGRHAFYGRSEEHTSELQSHSFISYAVFCLKKKKYKTLLSI